MRIYGDLFIQEMARISQEYISLHVFCSDDHDDIVRLVGAASFFSDGVKTITHVFFNKVDSGINAIRDLNHGSSGKISKKAKEQVMPHILGFVMGYTLRV